MCSTSKAFVDQVADLKKITASIESSINSIRTAKFDLVILNGRVNDDLQFISALDGGLLTTVKAPVSGWTQRALEAAELQCPEQEWDALIGSQWVGSSAQ